MKKLIVLFLILFPSFVWAAGSTIVTGDDLIRSVGSNLTIRKISIRFTSDETNGDVPEITIGEGSTTGFTHGPLYGWFAYKVEIDADLCNETGPRCDIKGPFEFPSDSDLYIYHKGVDLLAGQGVDAVDSDAEGQVYFYDNSTNLNPVRQPISSDLTIDLNQATAVAWDPYVLTNNEASIDIYFMNQ